MKPTLLIVDDDASHRMMLRTVLSGWDFSVRMAESGEDAIREVKQHPMDAILMDVRMAGISGIEALTRIREYNPALPVLIMTAYSSVNSARKALKQGAYDYLTKPLDFDELKIVLHRAMDHTRLKQENRELRQKLTCPDIPDIIGRSMEMRTLMEMAAMVAPTEATVLVSGPSGTGKELVARALHSMSGRKEKPFVAVNCAALTESLLESELFGHEKGAFTGADTRRNGRFVQADGGTLFLDEIGEIAPMVQAKLLRAIQEKEIQRVGSDTVFHVDVRIIAATNRNLAADVTAGQFREDLYYRLNVVPLAVPPLNRRAEDIPILAQFFLERFAEKNRKTVLRFTPRAMDMLLHHHWPGNVRELENAIERAVILCVGETISETDLPPGIRTDPTPSAGAVASGNRSLSEMEREAIFLTLQETSGNKSEAARRLGITRATLHKKLKHYGAKDSA